MKLKPLKEIMALTKEAFDESMAPLRARGAKARAESLLVELDVKLIDLEKEVNELVAKKDIDFEKVADKLDDIALVERRKEQFISITTQLFPEGI